MNIERYQRQIVLEEIGLAGQKKIANSKILVIGAGGLGVPVLQYLVASGVGEILIFDKDTVALSNLQRQVLYTEEDLLEKKVNVALNKLKKLNSEIKIEVKEEYFEKKHADIVLDYDLVVDCSDNFGTRYLLNDICCVYKKPLVSASIFGFEGQLTTFNYKEGASLRCLYKTPPDPNNRPACEIAGVLGATVGVLGSLQALEVIKVVLEKKEVLSGKLLLMNLLNLSFNQIKFDKNTEIINSTSVLGGEIYRGYNTMCNENLIIDVTYDEFKEMSKANEFEVLDVRTDEERKEFNIGGKHIPLHELPERGEAELDFNKDMLIYCKRGGRSAKAIEFLSANSYSGKLYNLKDGITPLKD